MTPSGGFPRVRVDFQNADAAGRVRLNTAGTLDDLATARVELENGLPLRLVDGELEADGRVVFSNDEQLWVAVVDWNEVIPS